MSASEKSKVVSDYLKSYHKQAGKYGADFIFQMDEIPCYFDLVRSKTMHFKGHKNVEGCDTGSSKKRYTVALTISMSGRLLPTMIIFKGLKNIPKGLIVPDGVCVTVAAKGSMNESTMNFYEEHVISSRGSYLANTPGLLIWDSYGTHVNAAKRLKTKYSVETSLIPGKFTRFLQPLDISLNGPFKAAMRNEWADWFSNSEIFLTKKGYRKRPSYQNIVTMVSNARKIFNSESISKSFMVCGFKEYGRVVNFHDLNTNLQKILNPENPQEIFEYSASENNSDTDEMIIVDGENCDTCQSSEDDNKSD